jgi:GNAT superfamily N-acetyltransferase
VIRAATPDDVPAIVRMTFDLAHATRQPVPLDGPMVARFVRALLDAADAFVRVVDAPGGPQGMLVASIVTMPLSPVRIAVEHGWFCGPKAKGQGFVLLAAYENWARERGAYAMRLSTPPSEADRAVPHSVLGRHGFALAEQAWVKVL